MSSDAQTHSDYSPTNSRAYSPAYRFSPCSFEWTGGNILNSSAAAELGFNIIGNILGSLQIRATVDSLSAVRESSESDNSLLINTNLVRGSRHCACRLSLVRPIDWHTAIRLCRYV
jgi:hypothetical protein